MTNSVGGAPKLADALGDLGRLLDRQLLPRRAVLAAQARGPTRMVWRVRCVSLLVTRWCMRSGECSRPSSRSPLLDTIEVCMRI